MNKRDDTPVISVVVPVYNVERYICQCVDSILAQDYPNLEVILINDKSSDKSGEICDEYAKKNERVYVIHSNLNQGLGLTRNVGIEHAMGEYITFIDSDDFISKNHISALFSRLQNNNADACYGGFTSYSGTSYTEHPTVLSGLLIKKPKILQDIIPLMCGRTRNSEAIQMSSCMAIYSKKIIDKNSIRFFSEREYISEDLLFNIEFLKSSKIVTFSDDVGYYYRYNPKSLSHSFRSDRLEKQILLTKKVSELTNELGIYEKAKVQIINTLLSWGRYCVQMEQRRWHEVGFRKSLERINDICYNPDIIMYSLIYKKGNDKKSSELLNTLIKKKKPLLLWFVMAFKNIRS